MVLVCFWLPLRREAGLWPSLRSKQYFHRRCGHVADDPACADLTSH
jgi:hypothetical protein